MGNYRAGIYIPSPQQAALLKQLRDGWTLQKNERLDSFYVTLPTHPKYSGKVNEKTARSLIEHGFVVEAKHADGWVTYRVVEQ